MNKHEKSQLKVNLVDLIIDERLRIGFDTSEKMEIDLWGRPRTELEQMLDELREKFGTFTQEDLKVVEDSEGKFGVSMLDGIYIDVPPFATREEAEQHIRRKFISKSEVMQ